MSSRNLLSEIKKQFGLGNLYEVLAITKNATKSEIKKAYYKLSLQVHPDRVADRDKAKATKKFQVLGRIYSILQDDNRRALYDEHGTVDDDDAQEMDNDWYDYWRLLFPRVNLSKLEEFEKNYKGSNEELEDLKEVYVSSGGDMDIIMDGMMCSTAGDEPRYRVILTNLVDAGELGEFDAFKNEKKKKRDARRRRAADEEEEADEMLKKLGKKDGDDLAAMILSNQRSRASKADDFFAQMEAKYCGGDAKKTSATSRKKATPKK